MVHKMRIPLGVVKQLVDMTAVLFSVTVLCCHRVQPRTGPSITLCAAKEQGPAPSVTSLLCHRTRPSKGVRLGPKTENCSYCTVLPHRKAQHSDFPYCTVLPQSRAKYRGLLLLYCLAKEHGPAR